MILVDLKQDKSKENRYFSNTLLESIETCLKEKKKIILYLNKRWDYSFLVCNNCAFLYKCKNCDSSMSIHNDFLLCHICSYAKKVENKCENCNKNELQKIWIWTAQIEKFLNEKYKWKRIFRFDTDNIKNKKEKEEALKNLENADIVIWTKMITTGFDLEWIWLIWIILLEQELQMPKYDTVEKIYSNLKQFMWRWWRKWEETKFIIQSYIAENPIINNLIYLNYKDFFSGTLNERKKFNYPPFAEFAILEYKHKDKEKSKKYIIKLKEKLEKRNTLNQIEIINYPIPFKKHWEFHTKIILKWKNLREFLNSFKDEIFSNSNLSIIFD